MNFHLKEGLGVDFCSFRSHARHRYRPIVFSEHLQTINNRLFFSCWLFQYAQQRFEGNYEAFVSVVNSCLGEERLLIQSCTSAEVCALKPAWPEVDTDLRFSVALISISTFLYSFSFFVFSHYHNFENLYSSTQ